MKFSVAVRKMISRILRAGAKNDLEIGAADFPSFKIAKDMGSFFFPSKQKKSKIDSERISFARY